MSDKLPPNLMIEDNGDEPMSNHSNNRHFSAKHEKGPLWPLFHA